MTFRTLLALLVLLAATLLPAAHGLRVSDLYYMDTDSRVSGNCAGPARDFDAAINEVRAIVDEALAALDLLRRPKSAIPASDEARRFRWVVSGLYFGTLFDNSLLENTDAEAEGLQASAAFATVRGTLPRWLAKEAWRFSSLADRHGAPHRQLPTAAGQLRRGF